LNQDCERLLLQTERQEGSTGFEWAIEEEEENSPLSREWSSLWNSDEANQGMSRNFVTTEDVETGKCWEYQQQSFRKKKKVH